MNNAGMFEGFGDKPTLTNQPNNIFTPKTEIKPSRLKTSPWMTITSEGVKLLNWNLGDSVGFDIRIKGRIFIPESNTFFELEDFIKNKIIEVTMVDFENTPIWSKQYLDLDTGKIPVTIPPSVSQKIKRGHYDLNVKVISSDGIENMLNDLTPGFVSEYNGEIVEDSEFPNSISSNKFPVLANKQYNIIGTTKEPIWSVYQGDLYIRQETGSIFVPNEDGEARVSFKQGLNRKEQELLRITTSIDLEPEFTSTVISNNYIEIIVH